MIVAAVPPEGRDPRDFYPTDPRVMTALIDRLDLSPAARVSVVDPCCGAGDLLLPWLRAGQDPWGADLYDYSDRLMHPDLAPVCRVWGADCIQRAPSWAAVAHLMCTNPPYSIAEEVIRAYVPVMQSTALLLRLSMLGSDTRASMWESLPSPKLQVLVPRPQFIDVCSRKGCTARYPRGVHRGESCWRVGCDGRVVAGSDNSEYAWFLWGPLFERLPPVGWLRWR